MRDINWAVLGTGVIANEMAAALKKNGKNIYAVGNRTYEKAVAFGEKYGIGKVYTDYNEMFTDPDVDVIYITTPHNTHKKFMKQARDIDCGTGTTGRVQRTSDPCGRLYGLFY